MATMMGSNIQPLTHCGYGLFFILQSPNVTDTWETNKIESSSVENDERSA